ncbi:MAG: adenylate kinase family protein [Candidatus Thorarchaeota archaeon]|nr:adenylate kinase family protein [Candidatus Thorarchaeota archaeon]
MNAIVIGGSPGCGKTTVASLLGRSLDRDVISLGELAVEKDCITEEDLERDTLVIDEDCMVKAIRDEIHKNDDEIILEGHYVDLVPFRDVEKVIILRVHPEALRTRLMERDYPEIKVRENVEAEVFGVCQMDAIHSFGEELVFEVDTTGLTPEETRDKIIDLLRGSSEPARIDWMQRLEKEGILDDYVTPQFE